MPQTIFYSWQSDLPNSTNRGFIQDMIEGALAELRSSGALKVDTVLDRDTAGVPGSPDIGLTIFSKINNAAVFVCDVSIINNLENERPSPNPNVLIELGYALKTMGASRIIMIMNTAYGKPELLPFDLRQKLVTTYELPEGQDKATAKQTLKGKLTEALRVVLDEVQENPAATDAQDLSVTVIEAISNGRPDTNRKIQEYMKWLGDELQIINEQTLEGELDDQLTEKLRLSIPLVKTFDQIANAISATASNGAANTLFKNLEHLAVRYRLPTGFAGSYRETDFDLFKFVGHELLVILVGYLMKDERWELINETLQNVIHLENHPSGTPDAVDFHALIAWVSLLDDYRAQRLAANGRRQTSWHADILKERHESLPLSENLTWQDFMDADHFLFHYSQINSLSAYDRWWPRTWVYYGNRLPRFIVNAYSNNGAISLKKALNIPADQKLRPKIKAAVDAYQEGLRNTRSGGFLSNPYGQFNEDRIADV